MSAGLPAPVAPHVQGISAPERNQDKGAGRNTEQCQDFFKHDRINLTVRSECTKARNCHQSFADRRAERP
jgi:hypothetical protein